MKLQITETKTVDATPRLLAQAFFEMDNEAQADFFDHLYNVADGKLDDQMQNVALFTDNLSLDALRAMSQIGKHAMDRISEGEL